MATSATFGIELGTDGDLTSDFELPGPVPRVVMPLLRVDLPHILIEDVMQSTLTSDVTLSVRASYLVSCM